MEAFLGFLGNGGMTLLAGVGSFLMRYMAEQVAMIERLAKVDRENQKANDDSADRAAQRYADDNGKWIRRFIVVLAVTYVFFWSVAFTLAKYPIVAETIVHHPAQLFGLIPAHEEVVYTYLNGFLIPERAWYVVQIIIGAYFGNAIGARKA